MGSCFCGKFTFGDSDSSFGFRLASILFDFKTEKENKNLMEEIKEDVENKNANNSEPTTFEFWDSLPDELQALVFSLIEDDRAYSRASQVSRDWQKGIY